MIQPFSPRTEVEYDDYGTLTYGLGPAGYDIRIDQELTLNAGSFQLASSVERFDMPPDVLARVTDKSTWARRGLCVQNTVIEPGWRGYLTLELTNHSEEHLWIPNGAPIAQVLFELLDEPTAQAYNGKYQNQQSGPQGAR